MEGGTSSSTGRVYAARIWDATSGTELHVLGKLEPGGLDEGSGSGVMNFPFGSDYAVRRSQQGGDSSAGQGGRAGNPDKMLSSSDPANWEETFAAVFSPDGRHVATGSLQGTVKIWDVQTGKPLRSWKGIAKQIHALDYSPDGSRLLLVYADGNKNEVAVWSTSEGKELVHWGGFSTGVRAAHFSPNGLRVLIVPGNEWRRRQPKQFLGTNGELVFANPEDRTVYLRDVESGQDIALFKGHESDVTFAQFNADGSEVVTAEEDGTVRFWNSGDRWQYGTELPGPASVVAEAAFSPDGRCVMTTFGRRREVFAGVGGERSVRVWNKDTGKLLHTLKEDLGLNKRPANESLLGTMRSLLLLRGSADTTGNNMAEDQILGAVRHAEFSPDGSRLLTVSEDSFVLRAGDASPADRKGPGGNNILGSRVDKLSTGASVLFAPVRVWDVASGKKLASLTGFTAGVRSAALSPDGRRIVTVADNTYKYVHLDAKDQSRGTGSQTPAPERDAAVRVWDAESGQQIAVLLGPDCLVLAVRPGALTGNSCSQPDVFRTIGSTCRCGIRRLSSRRGNCKRPRAMGGARGSRYSVLTAGAFCCCGPTGLTGSSSSGRSSRFGRWTERITSSSAAIRGASTRRPSVRTENGW